MVWAQLQAHGIGSPSWLEGRVIRWWNELRERLGGRTADRILAEIREDVLAERKLIESFVLARFGPRRKVDKNA